MVKHLRNRYGVFRRNCGPEGAEAARIYDFRRRDRLSFQESESPLVARHVYHTDANLRVYGKCFNTDFARIARKLLIKQGSINVLDIGAGQGLFGIELQNTIGREKISLYGAGLTRPFGIIEGTQRITAKKLALLSDKPWNRFAAYHVGDFRKKGHLWFKDNTFDMIVSKSAEFIELENLTFMAKLLKQDGVAYFLMNYDPFEGQKIQDMLQETGVYMEAVPQSDSASPVRLMKTTDGQKIDAMFFRK